MVDRVSRPRVVRRSPSLYQWLREAEYCKIKHLAPLLTMGGSVVVEWSREGAFAEMQWCKMRFFEIHRSEAKRQNEQMHPIILKSVIEILAGGPHEGGGVYSSLVSCVSGEARREVHFVKLAAVGR